MINGTADVGRGRYVLTTGANSGIGLAVAIGVARHGFRSVGTVRSEEKGEYLRSEAAKAGVEVEPVILDITDPDACAEVMRRYPYYGLINNAGSNATGAIEDMSDADAHYALNTMTIAPLRLARLAIPAMRAQGGGRIIMISSPEGQVTIPLTGWYQAAKHGLEAASSSLRVELARDHIMVSIIEPGSVKTNIWHAGIWADNAYPGSAYAASYESLRKILHMGHKLHWAPEDAARVIVGALTSQSPRRRYVLGIDSKLMVLTDKILPAALKDRLYRQMFKL
jgi:short-subunit dehydrogenase